MSNIQLIVIGLLLSYIAAIVTRITLQLKAGNEQAVVSYRDEASTGGRPLSAEPLIIEQPVPCSHCKTTHYADWTLWPHQMYNKYAKGGVGHYCFPCFAKLVQQIEMMKESGL